MNFYYFVKNNSIQEFLTPMSGDAFVELTPEQLAFWREHPTATAYEVRNCELNEPYVAPTKTLEEIKSEAIKEVDSKSRETMGLHVDTLSLADAMTSILFAQTKNAPAIYDNDKATETIEKFLAIGKACRDTFHEAEELILACDNAENVAEILDMYLRIYDNIGNE